MMIDDGYTSSYLPPLVIKLLAFIFSVLLPGRCLFLVLSGKGDFASYTRHLSEATPPSQTSWCLVGLPYTAVTEVFGWKKLQEIPYICLVRSFLCHLPPKKLAKRLLPCFVFAVVGVAGHMDTRATTKDLGCWNHRPDYGNPAFDDLL